MVATIRRRFRIHAFWEAQSHTNVRPTKNSSRMADAFFLSPVVVREACVRGSAFFRTVTAVALALVTAGTMASSPAIPQMKISVDEIAAGKTMGSKNAPLRLEDFTDFECPACKYLFEHTTKMVIEDYVNTGKVYLIHHDFPLSMHQYSKEAAYWGECGRRHRKI